VIDGWSAWRWLEGEHTPRRWPEIIAAGEAFHQVLEGVERPTFIDRRAHPWAIGDKVAWGELPPDDYKRASISSVSLGLSAGSASRLSSFTAT
jgi:hypothetical protein